MATLPHEKTRAAHCSGVIAGSHWLGSFQQTASVRVPWHVVQSLQLGAAQNALGGVWVGQSVFWLQHVPESQQNPFAQ
jgi:hypothetical protein